MAAQASMALLHRPELAGEGASVPLHEAGSSARVRAPVAGSADPGHLQQQVCATTCCCMH